MPLISCPLYIHEPTSLQCGQAVLAMLTGQSIDKIIADCGTDRETTLACMFSVLRKYEIGFDRTRIQVTDRKDLPEVCILSLETPHCWHWSLYFRGTFFDPEYGILEDFPPSARRYFWKIES